MCERSWMRSHITKTSSARPWSSSSSSCEGSSSSLVIVGGGAHHPTEAGGLAVLEDRAPGERRDLAHRHRLGEQHRGVGVVAGGEVDEPQRDEQLVRVALLEPADELGPDDLGDERLDVLVGRAVLRVHREHHEVAQAVDAVVGGCEGDERVEEVGHAEAVGLPAGEVDGQRLEVGGVVREGGGEGADAGDDRGDVLARGRRDPTASGTLPSAAWMPCSAIAAAFSWCHAALCSAVEASSTTSGCPMMDGVRAIVVMCASSRPSSLGRIVVRLGANGARMLRGRTISRIYRASDRQTTSNRSNTMSMSWVHSMPRRSPARVQ